jgi:hypothetical protein
LGLSVTSTRTAAPPRPDFTVATMLALPSSVLVVEKGGLDTDFIWSGNSLSVGLNVDAHLPKSWRRQEECEAHKAARETLRPLQFTLIHFLFAATQLYQLHRIGSHKQKTCTR